MSALDFTHDLLRSGGPKDKATVRPLSVPASESAAFLVGRQTRELEDGGALSRRRYAG
jgi:hypothetical protein